MADLSAGIATTARGSDTLVGIENVEGSDEDDAIVGDAGPNLLTGGRGSDTLEGADGDERSEAMRARIGSSVGTGAMRSMGAPGPTSA